jgi:hypothetical protein
MQHTFRLIDISLGGDKDVKKNQKNCAECARKNGHSLNVRLARA